MKTVDEAVRERIKELLAMQNQTISSVCLAGGLTPSTLYDFMKGTTAHIQLNTVKRVCLGFGITMSEFFNKADFDDFE